MASLDYGTVIYKNGERYKGDELFPSIDELNVSFYKNYMYYPEKYIVDGKAYSERAITFGWDNKKSYRFIHDGNKYWVKEICLRVYRCEIIAGADKYFIVFGYGIDGSKSVWNDVKYSYLGRRRADKVDRILNRIDNWRME